MTEEDVRALTKIDESCSNWQNSLKKSQNKRRLEKMDQDIQKLITPEDIKCFKDSKMAAEATKILKTTDNLTLTEYVLVRDFLMASIVLRNANRTGVLSNMTVEELEEGVRRSEVVVLSVKDHKTAHLSGPAKVVMTTELYQWLTIFKTHI